MAYNIITKTSFKTKIMNTMSITKPKILILQGEISHYRLEIFNIIADQFELTVGYYDQNRSKNQIQGGVRRDS